jgi:adenylate kinase family enzyme
MPSPRKKIILIGSGGAGKSTMARRLGGVLNLPVYHLDALFWRAGWQESSRDELRRKQEFICAQDAWVIDGNYGGTLDVRLAAVDTVIFLDLPRTVCLFRAIKRSVLLHGKTRLDMAPDCPERFNREFFKFLKWIWDYPVRSRPGVLTKLESLRGRKEIVILRTSREVTAFLASLPSHPGLAR